MAKKKMTFKEACENGINSFSFTVNSGHEYYPYKSSVLPRQKENELVKQFQGIVSLPSGCGVLKELWNASLKIHALEKRMG